MVKGRIYANELSLATDEAYGALVDLLFDSADTVILYSREEDFTKKFFSTCDLSPIVHEAYRSAVTEHTLALYFRPSPAVREYFRSLRAFNALTCDASLSHAPYVYFSDPAFMKDGEPLVTFRRSDGEVLCEAELAEKARKIYYDCLRRDDLYIKIRENYEQLPAGRKRFYLDKGIRLLKNLLLYRECEVLAAKPNADTKKLNSLKEYLTRDEMIRPSMYKEMLRELFPPELMPEIDYAENFSQIAVISPRIESFLYKLAYYLETEANTPPSDRSYVS